MMMKYRDLLFVILVASSLVLAWLIGSYRDQADLTGFLAQVLPDAQRFDSQTEGVYVGYSAQGGQDRAVGYVSVAEAMGHSGPIQVAVGLDREGKVRQVALVRQTEAAPFIRRIIHRGLPETLVGKSWTSKFKVGLDIDAVTGATATLEGLTEAIRAACRNAAAFGGGRDQPDQAREVRFGWAEAVLVGLYVVGYLAYGRSDRMGRQLRLLTMAVGLVVVGFWLGGPISLIDINSFLLGYWPAWQGHLYWYLLLGGVLLPVILTGRSLYCSHVCPFGAIQELAAGAGRTRPVPVHVEFWLRWLQRALVWVAVVVALVWRNPTLAAYDVSGALFLRVGLTWQFVLLAGALLAALLITRPWCNYLCPIRAITDFLGLVRVVVVGKNRTNPPAP